MKKAAALPATTAQKSTKMVKVLTAVVVAVAAAVVALLRPVDDDGSMLLMKVGVGLVGDGVVVDVLSPPITTVVTLLPPYVCCT